MRIFSIIRNILGVIAVVILICAALCLVLKLKPAVVMSGSMEPAFPVGSTVFVKQGSAYGIGDAVAFHNSSAYVTHRIVAEKAVSDGSGNTVKAYITKGDANKTEDPGYLTADRIEGKVILCIPIIGYAINFAGSRQGVIMIGALILCLVLSLFMTSPETETGERAEGKHAKGKHAKA